MIQYVLISIKIKHACLQHNNSIFIPRFLKNIIFMGLFHSILAWGTFTTQRSYLY